LPRRLQLKLFLTYFEVSFEYLMEGTSPRFVTSPIFGFIFFIFSKIDESVNKGSTSGIEVSPEFDPDLTLAQQIAENERQMYERSQQMMTEIEDEVSKFLCSFKYFYIFKGSQDSTARFRQTGDYKFGCGIRS